MGRGYATWPDEPSQAWLDMLYSRCCAMSLARLVQQREPRPIVQKSGGDFAQRFGVCEVADFLP